MRGSLLKRGETWSYVLYLGRGPDGKKQQKWVGGFRTRREAEAALTEALERVRTGTWADPGRQTVGEYLEDWLTAVRPSLRSSTANELRAHAAEVGRSPDRPSAPRRALVGQAQRSLRRALEVRPP
jgi:hypothetical protein